MLASPALSNTPPLNHSMVHDPLVRNHVQHHGNPAGPVLVFGSGFGTEQRAWAEVCSAFAASHHLITFDNVGEGASLRDAYSKLHYSDLRAYATDLIEILEACALPPATYVGHSFAGMVGVVAAALRPDLFERLVLLGASPHYLQDGDYNGGFTAENVTGLLATMEANYLDWATGFAPMAMENPDRPELALRFADTLKQLRPDVAWNIIRTIFASDWRSLLPTIAMPVLIIQAEHDLVVPVSVGEYMQAHFPMLPCALHPPVAITRTSATPNWWQRPFAPSCPPLKARGFVRCLRKGLCVQ